MRENEYAGPMKASQAVPPLSLPVVKEEPKRRPRPLIRSAGIRLAMVYATVFGLSAFALAF